MNTYVMMAGSGLVELPVGKPFTSDRFLVQTEAESAWSMAPIGETVTFEVSHGPAFLDDVDEANLLRFLIQSVEVEEPPEGQREASRAFVDTDGVYSCVVTFEETPPPPMPTEIPMWKLRRFLILNAMMTTATTFLESIPGIDGEIARSDFASAPNFVVAGPFAKAFKAAQGLTDEQWRGMVLAANAITG
jgi:hypothetical protein